ncbi:hypothetical protein HDU92_008450 [Lobulomyces angularis]|nr:hypothetical protein HDU92_008450 [Lobulomyces angularis]
MANNRCNVFYTDFKIIDSFAHNDRVNMNSFNSKLPELTDGDCLINTNDEILLFVLAGGSLFYIDPNIGMVNAMLSIIVKFPILYWSDVKELNSNVVCTSLKDYKDQIQMNFVYIPSYNLLYTCFIHKEIKYHLLLTSRRNKGKNSMMSEIEKIIVSSDIIKVKYIKMTQQNNITKYAMETNIDREKTVYIELT